MPCLILSRKLVEHALEWDCGVPISEICTVPLRYELDLKVSQFSCKSPWLQTIKLSPSFFMHIKESWKDVAPISSNLVKSVQTHHPAVRDYMLEQSLHRTLHMNVGPDRDYDKQRFNKMEPEKLNFIHVYRTENTAAVSVSHPCVGKALVAPSPMYH